MDIEPLISAELADHLQSGLALTIGCRNGKLESEGTRAWAIVVDDDRLHATVFVHTKPAGAILRNLESHPEVALAIDRPTDSRACQLKGTFAGSRRARPSERAEVARQVDGFLKELEALGIPRAMTAGWRTWPCVAIRFRVTQLFQQTPGPGAGEPMR